VKRPSVTNGGGGKTLLELHPKEILSLSRDKFERGLFPLSIEKEIPHFVQNDRIIIRTSGFYGVSSKGGLFPFRLKWRCLTSFDLTINGGGKVPFSDSTRRKIKRREILVSL
jgi:hypothetical protein